MNDVYLGGRPERQRQPLRFLTFGLIALLVFGTLATRLFYLQIVNGSTLAARAERNRTVADPIVATRGQIFDRAGRELVSNVASFAVKIRPSELPETRRDEVAERLAALLGIEPSTINEAIDGNPGSRFDLVRIAQDVPEATARLVAESNDELPGVEVVVETRRSYPYGPLFSHILGYTGPIDAEALEDRKDEGYLPDDMIGQTALEATFEEQLRGTYGAQLVERDATGRRLQVLSTVQEAIPGASLALTIDTKTQKMAEEALLWGMREAGLKRGVLIAMNPQTGEILALVSLPTYDNNLFATGISNEDFAALVDDPEKPLTNHAIQVQFPPGSTYKLVAATGALADGRITPTTRLMTRPYLTLGSTRFYEWNRRGWGPFTVYQGFGRSSDTFFFQLAGMLGIDRLGYWAKQYGFGEPTGIELPGEVGGIVPTNQWKQDTLGQPIYPGEVYQAGIGQGYVAVTPLQLINAYAALANGGKILQPQLVRQVVGPDGTVIRDFQPRVVREMDVPASTLRTMREAARWTITMRQTYNLVELPVKVAGKTGTAEFGLRDSEGRLPYHSWFVGFTGKDPYSDDYSKPDSELVVLALAYDSRTKGNAATEIVKGFFQLYYGIEKDYRIKDLLERGNFYQGN